MLDQSILYRTPGDEPAMEPWAVGCFASGFPASILDSTSKERPAAAFAAICGGPMRYRENNQSILDHYHGAGVPVFMIEASSLSHHQLIFMNSKQWLPPAPLDAITRRVKLGLVCWPKPRGHKIMVLGQGPAQDSVLEPHLQKLSTETTRPIMYRRHPHDHREEIPDGCDAALPAANSLEDDLENSWAVITHSSGAAIQALLRGIPVFSSEEAIFKWSSAPLYQLWRIEDQEPEAPSSVHRFMDRYAFVNWSEQEIRDGDALRFFKSFF